MMIRKFTLEESLQFVIAACRVRDEQDRELGELLLAGLSEDTPEAWGRVHDRMNVMGDFAGADRLRRLIKE